MRIVSRLTSDSTSFVLPNSGRKRAPTELSWDLVVEEHELMSDWFVGEELEVGFCGVLMGWDQVGRVVCEEN